MKSFLYAALMVAGMAAGQAQDVSILPYPAPQRTYPELKAYLNLSDAQVTSLSAIATARQAAQQNVYQQVSEKYRQLQTLLNANTTDSTRVGQLMIEINTLQKQRVPTEPYRSQALNVLTAEQRAKLPALVQALQIQSPAWQATSLNLIDNPNTISPRSADFGIGEIEGGAVGLPVLLPPVEGQQ